jgi:hypothetical protein
MISFLIFLTVLAITISILPEIFANIIGFSMFALMLIILITALREEKKEKKQYMSKESYEKQLAQYIDLVNETNYEGHNLNTNWIQIFNQAIYDVATNHYLLKRMFNDFDIAACLIYSLTLDDNTDENILFAFDCAKKIINEPKEYIRDLGYGYKLEFKVEKTFTKVNICLPDENINSKALASIIRAYIMQKTELGILQLSDFLHVLYLIEKVV